MVLVIVCGGVLGELSAAALGMVVLLADYVYLWLVLWVVCGVLLWLNSVGV